MPKIQWSNLPLELRDHLFERARERKISIEDLFKLKLWRETEPDAHDGPWYKDFGSFKICGEGQLPKTLPPPRPARKKERKLSRTTDQSSILALLLRVVGFERIWWLV